jgi:hypothetical protein
MFKRAALTIVVFAGLTASAWAASPAGVFEVTGTNPGSGTRYVGTVTVRATGSTFRVTWRIAGQTIVGTGMWVDNKFVVGYPGNSVACLTEQGDGSGIWSGHWANGSSTQVGTERWTR